MASQWFCRARGQELGPITSHKLLEMARAGQLQPDDLVKKNDSDWVKALAVRGLFEESRGSSVSISRLNESRPSESSSASRGDAATLADSAHLATPVDRPPSAPNRSDAKPKPLGRGLAIGSELGNYTILAKLGEGGMGMVLKARHRRMDRMVALKVLHGQATQSEAAVKRFQFEVRAAARLVHPHIVTAYDADEAGGVHFLVMEFVDGVSLAEVVGRNGPLPIRDAVNYILQAARGLRYAHSEGVVHRDIKPGNLLLDKRGTVKIMDMGLARMDETEAVIAGAMAQESLTKVGQVLGTLDYMSPEQAEDASRADQRADIYSLGCTFFRLLTGRAPYRGETVINKIVAHRDQPIPSLTEARTGVTSELEAVFRRMVAKKPDDRYPTMDELIADLELYLEHGKVRAETVRLATAGTAEVNGKRALLPTGQAVHQPRFAGGDDSDSFELAPLDDGTRSARIRPGKHRDPHTVNFICKVMGEDLGPLSFGQLEHMKRKQQITPEDSVRYVDDDRWFPAIEIAGLF